MRVRRPRGILVQMFGLMFEEKWKQNQGIPFVMTHLKKYVEQNLEDVDLLHTIHSLRISSRSLGLHDETVPVILDDNHPVSSEIIDSVYSFYSWLRSMGRGSHELRYFEDLVISDGLKNDLIKVSVYEDVFPAFSDWKKEGIKIFIDCPHLKLSDVKLFLMKTTAGDLSPLLDGVFGNEQEFMTRDAKESYKRVLDKISIPVPDLLYITHFGQKAKFMAEVMSMSSLIVDRDENRKVRSYYMIRFPTVKDLREITFVEKPKKKK